MEKEISQTLEEVRRQNDMRRIQDLQNQVSQQASPCRFDKRVVSWQIFCISTQV